MIITFLDDRSYTMDLMSSGAIYDRWFADEIRKQPGSAFGRSIVKTGKIISYFISLIF